MGHVVNGYLNANTYPAASTAFYRIYNILYAFHMPLFMTISGFVFEMAYFNEDGSAKRSKRMRQVLNLLGNYVVFSLAYGLGKILLGGRVNSGVTFRDLLLIPVKPIDLYWYIYDLMIFYILFSQVVIRKIHRGVLIVILFLIACFSGMLSVPYLDLERLLHYAFFFCFGMTIRRMNGLDRFFQKGITPVVILCVTLVLGIVFWNGNAYSAGAKRLCYSSIPIVNVLFALGLTLTFFFVFRKWAFLSKNRWLSVLGKHSLEIYLLHCFLTAGIRIVFVKFGVVNAVAGTLFNFALSTTIPLVVSFCCTRMGIYELIFKPAAFLEKRKKSKKE